MTKSRLVLVLKLASEIDVPSRTCVGSVLRLGYKKTKNKKREKARSLRCSVSLGSNLIISYPGLSHPGVFDIQDGGQNTSANMSIIFLKSLDVASFTLVSL